MGLQEGRMVPWQKLPNDLQKAVLALVVLSGRALSPVAGRWSVTRPAAPHDPYPDDDTDVHR